MAALYEGNNDLTSVDYNRFFHPNVCHVCKLTDQARLISCYQCDMTSYCSEEHRRQHQPQHEEICTFITRFINEDPIWNTRRLVKDRWLEVQKELVRIAKMVLNELTPYHIQMILYAKSCFVCHQRGNVFSCPKCISFHYCFDHMELVREHHPRIQCVALALSLKLDIIALEKRSWEILHVKFTTFPSKKKPFTNMESFGELYFQTQTDDYEWCLYDHLFTDYVSGPLTTHNVLRRVNFFYPMEITSTFVVHIIAADYVDRCSFPAWELFLHLLRKGSKLIIVMMGPELEIETSQHDNCSRCKATRKKLILECFPVMYHIYVNNAMYKRPNIIVGFQAELSDERTWTESIRAIQTQKCPLLLTTKRKSEARQNISRIQKVLGTYVKPIQIIKNKFHSFRPSNDSKANSVTYRNMYLMIYKNLNNPLNEIQASSSFPSVWLFYLFTSISSLLVLLLISQMAWIWSTNLFTSNTNNTNKEYIQWQWHHVSAKTYHHTHCRKRNKWSLPMSLSIIFTLG